MQTRDGIAYVVEINGPEIVLNLKDGHTGQVAGHSEGISGIGQPGDLIGIQSGSELNVLRIQSIQFFEPKEVHIQEDRNESLNTSPLRQINARSIGYLFRQNDQLIFESEEWHLPALGSEAFPLSTKELQRVYEPFINPENTEAIDKNGNLEYLKVGREARNNTTSIRIDTNKFLTRHSAILGSTGYGKTTFVAAILHELAKLPKSRIVVFDINNEYYNAFRALGSNVVKKTIIGTTPIKNPEEGVEYFKIPYYSLGRAGLIRLLMPSDKAQLSPLKFAIDNLKFVISDSQGARHQQGENIFFDDCREEKAAEALGELNLLRSGQGQEKESWPNMKALSCLAAEWHSLKLDSRGNPRRDGFLHGQIQNLINRIRGHIEDELFREVVDIEGGKPEGDSLSWRQAGQQLVENIFGSAEHKNNSWKIHIIDLSRMTQDLSPFILGALLELFATELFRRGPGNTHPTLLVLEEAHHYMRALPNEGENSSYSLAYERLAKEGRKFGLSMLVSTQRPSELSTTVLSQCGTWAVFRLTNERDQSTVKSASEWGNGYIVKQIPGLPRGQAILFGAAVSTPCRVDVITPEKDKRPNSYDSNFIKAWSNNTFSSIEEVRAESPEPESTK